MVKPANKKAISTPVKTLPVKPLFGFVGDEHEDSAQGIPFSLIDYIELLDWTSRVLRPDKRGAIAETHPRLLQSLGIDDEMWCELASSFGKNYHGVVGWLVGWLVR